MLPSFDGAEP